MRGDTRRAAISTSHSENCGIGILLYFRPHLRLIKKHNPLFMLQNRLYAGLISGKPRDRFFQKFPSAAEAYINQVNGFALNCIETRRKRMRLNVSRRLPARIQNGTEG
jgi:hypothetical protein